MRGHIESNLPLPIKRHRSELYAYGMLGAVAQHAELDGRARGDDADFR
jgi:hypothetical protein